MSLHSSLKGVSVGSRHRNVLKRHERIRELHVSDKWGERQSAYKLPKLKLIKLKVKKTKSAKEGEGEAAPGAAPSAPQATPQQKPAQQKSVGEKTAKGKEKT